MPRDEDGVAREALTWVAEHPRLQAALASSLSDTESGILVQRADGVIVACNDRAGSVLGLTVDELFERAHRDARWTVISDFGLPLRTEEYPAMRTLADGNPVHDFVFGVHVPPGSLDGQVTRAENRWVLGSTIPLRDPAGGPDAPVIGVLSLLTDISDSDRGHEATVRLLEAYRLLVEYSPEAIVHTGPDSVIRWVSATLTPMLGWSPAQIVGHHISEFIHRDDLAGIKVRQADLLAQGLRGGRVEFRMATADGSWRWVSDAGRALFGAPDEVVGGIDTLRDIQDEVEAREALASSERQYRLLAENATDVVYRTNGTEIDWVSPSVTEALGWLPSQVLGHQPDEFLHPDDVEMVHQDRTRITSGDRVHRTMRLRASDGSYHWVRLAGGPSRSEDGTIEGVVASFRLADHEVQSERELARRATIDDLTGTLKRRPMLERLRQASDHPRQPGAHTAVLFIDIDDFKAINDRWGHAAGDAVLEAVAARILATLRTSDAVARMGGDEFLALLDGIHDLDEAIGVAEKIRIAC
ncbi:MAG: PAS domain S-box protein, partial [Candidatus Nanopelagicales bacterium]|nr:PAS domain S-box protein [Candidatus Nanopelagicales bacterium]